MNHPLHIIFMVNLEGLFEPFLIAQFKGTDQDCLSRQHVDHNRLPEKAVGIKDAEVISGVF